MAIDASIFSNALRPLPTAQEYLAANLGNQQNALKLQSDQQALADQNALRQATMQLGNDPSQNLQTLRQAGLFAPSQAYQKSLYDNQQTQSTTGKNLSEIPLNQAKTAEQTALAGSHDLDTQVKSHDFAVQKLAAVTDPSQVPQWIHDNTGPGKAFDYDQGMQGYQRFQQAIQQPGGFDAWKQQALQSGMSATDQLKQQQAAQIAAQVQAGETARNAATNQTHLQAANIAASTSRANNQDTIGKDYKVAGIDPQTGNFVGAGDGSTNGMAGMVDALGTYKLDPSQAFSRMAPAMRAGVISAVQQKYPDYDPTTYGAKKSAATAFTTGPQGNSLRSFAVAGQHLDQLGQLADALNNGNSQLVNQIGNKIAEQFGGTAPTNFDAAKDIVGKEVVKAIVAGGGGVAEREELSKQLSNAKSPAQLKGVIAQYQGLMGAQHDALLQQRRAAGLPDSTIPAYIGSGGGAPAALPTKNQQGWVLHQDAKGNKAYVSPDGKQFQQVGQ